MNPINLDFSDNPATIEYPLTELSMLQAAIDDTETATTAPVAVVVVAAPLSEEDQFYEDIIGATKMHNSDDAYSKCFLCEYAPASDNDEMAEIITAIINVVSTSNIDTHQKLIHVETIIKKAINLLKLTGTQFDIADNKFDLEEVRTHAFRLEKCRTSLLEIKRRHDARLTTLSASRIIKRFTTYVESAPTASLGTMTNAATLVLREAAGGARHLDPKFTSSSSSSSTSIGHNAAESASSSSSSAAPRQKQKKKFTI